MYFKSLEMLGFKSFVDETKVEFEPGITAIVGPNGCGKSNISDAIRWVLGEQSAKILRGNKMDDFIFNGSESRKPLNMAEVSLTITNFGGVITASEFSAYEEITVMRRLFRSGESEYYINKTPCRLKDVVDVFLDSGINTRGFSIMEQGQVNRIINSKPEDRRFIIEEAAGVMKYKHRRNAAIQKLESSQQNLLRIGDIVGELEKQMNSLKRQANRAERYKKYRGEVKELGLKLISVDLKKISGAINGVDAECNEYKEKEVDISAKCSSAKNRLENLRTELTIDEKVLGGLRNEEFEMRSRIERNEEHIKLVKKQIESLMDDDRKIENEIEELKREIKDQDDHSAKRKEEIEKYLIETEEQNRLYGEKEDSLLEMNQEYKEKQSILERLDAEVLRLTGQISQRKNTLISLEMKLNFVQKRKEKAIIERTEMHDSLVNLIKSLEDNSNKVTEIIKQLDSYKKDKEDLSRHIDKLRGNLKFHEEGISDIKMRLSANLSLQKSLEELQTNFEGYDDGVKSVMKSRENGTISGVHGVLIDFIETSPEFEIAIESVLGDRLQGVVVENHNDGMKAVEYLKSQSAGRAKFIPLDLRNSGKGGHAPNGNGSVIGNAADLLKCNEKYRDILECLCGDVLLVNNMETAVNLWRSNGSSHTIVTLDGEVIDPSGSITGGKKGGDRQGLMQRRRQISEIRTEIEKLKTELESAAKKGDEIKSEIGSFELKMTDLENSVREKEYNLMKEENISLKTKEEIERLNKKMETVEFEIKGFDKEIEEFTAEVNGYREEVLKENEYHGNMMLQYNKIKDDIKILREGLDALISDANVLKINLTSLNGKIEGFRMEVERIEEAKKDLALRIEKDENNRIEIAGKKKEMEGSVKDMEEQIYQLSLKRDEKKKEMNMKIEFLKERSESMKAMEDEVKAVEAELSGLKDTINSLTLNKTELNLQLSHLRNRALEEYNVKESEITEVTVEDVNTEEINNRLEFLRGEIEKIGDDVNLTAIEEYKSISERYNFLKTQQDDLLHSIKSLHQTIEKIDGTTKNMFSDTFIKVNENFKGIFRKLFGGGRAELVLIDKENILETGIDIIVQPPGKKLQNITLLSSGEKAMTAITLLFSIFMVKPSPFCLLDEVDAPLDEANIFRFRDMLKEMRSNTQFIVITHNQKTMSFADTLYGITMEEDGVSKIISVNLQEREMKAA